MPTSPAAKISDIANAKPGLYTFDVADYDATSVFLKDMRQMEGHCRTHGYRFEHQSGDDEALPWRGFIVEIVRGSVDGLYGFLDTGRGYRK